MADLHALIEKLITGESLTVEEYTLLVKERTPDTAARLAAAATEKRQAIYGNTVYIRGLIEISNICKNDCHYCGIRAGNRSCDRYRLTEEDILSACAEGYELGFRTFVLQGGEDGHFTDERLTSLLRSIKTNHPDCAVTLSLGERSRESYQKLFDAGADRYLLRHETATKSHYERLHPAPLSFDERMRCLYDLREIGYQVGCGFMVGSPYQTPEDIARDLKFIEGFKPDMCGIGPFIPHKDTVFADFPAGTLELTCYLLSIVRLIHPPVLLPSTTALGTIHPEGRELGILAGANVVMPNLSPASVRKKYMLYDNKVSDGAESAQSKDELVRRMTAIDYEVVTDRGDVKKTSQGGPPMRRETICNPININYRYQAPMRSRESADPAVVLYKDEYYLFASHGSGYWVSPDLAHWEFIEVDIDKQPEFELYAPGPVVAGDRLYITHSQGGGILYSDNPRDPDSWIYAGRPYGWNDPSLFVDDDGSLYCYEGLSPDFPIRVAKLDPQDLSKVLEGPVDIYQSDRDTRGYERPGDHNERDGGLTFLEGPWMNKINGKYYLTFAVPGTEYAGYCDGCAVADSPMGPFTYCENSPVVYKATGFMRGAGHGCLFEDKNGHYWKMDTVSIGVNHMFERRLCLFPAKVENGFIYTNAYRGDYPQLLPHDTADPFTQSDAGWHLLSLNKTARAFSVLDGDHTPDKALDESLRTWWSAETGSGGEWLWTDLGKVYDVCAIQINFADQDAEAVGGRGHGFAYRYRLEASEDGKDWNTIIDRSDSTEDLPHDYTELEQVTPIRHLMLVNFGEIPAGGKFAVSGLRVFGYGGGEAPANAPDFTVKRGEDTRNMTVTWKPVEGAQGYFIRWGIDPNNLHTHWQVIGDCEATVYCLTKEVTYFVTVDAYNESGVTYGTQIQTT